MGSMSAEPRNGGNPPPAAKQPLGFCLFTGNPEGAARWKHLFGEQGWNVEFAQEGDKFLALAGGCRAGLAIVDLRVLKGRGIAELKRRAPHMVWIVLGTTGPTDGPEAARCLDEGAEDYIPAGFDETILVAKMRGHVRRLLPRFAVAGDKIEDPSGTLRIDRAANRVEIRDPKGKWVPTAPLTELETRILCFLVQRSDLVLGACAILEGVWLDRAGDVTVGAVERRVEALRKKLGPMAARIQTVYGRGYVFRGM